MRRDSERVLSHLIASLSCSYQPTNTVSIIWSAGITGFSATKTQTDNEIIGYEIVLELTRHILSTFPSSKIIFHLVSSAGGLFEGQTIETETAKPLPLRSYGKLKYEQEKKLLQLESCIEKHIYRPTSVYGFSGYNHRKGLVSTLLLNGIMNKISTIFGDLNTLRDYIYNDNVGDFIVGQLLSESNTQKSIYYLGSGKPSSIYEIKHLVERALGKKIYLNFVKQDNENVLDTALNPKLLPHNWRPTDIKTGINLVKESIISEIDNKTNTDRTVSD